MDAAKIELKKKRSVAVYPSDESHVEKLWRTLGFRSWSEYVEFMIDLDKTLTKAEREERARQWLEQHK